MVRLAVASAGIQTCCACAIDGSGTLYADVSDGGDATIVRTVGVGLQVRTRKDDAGLSLGVSERTYVFPKAGIGEPPSAGRHYLHVALPDEPSLAVTSFTAGAELSMSPEAIDLVVGLTQRVVLARLPVATDAALSVSFDGSASEPFQVTIHCGWGAPCP